jgi:uroporphyrin-III C-methyltransferase/precorrin-2 dehydrogenase/sirohydrochlorin ferrochelatase
MAATPSTLPYLPIFLRVKGRPCVIIGIGRAADAKRALLTRAGAVVRAVTPDAFVPADLDGALLVVVADEDPDLAARATAAARARGLPINVVDRPEACDFIFPALLDRAPVVVAVSTGGLAPSLARLIRQRLELAIPAGFGRLAALAGDFREAVRARLPAGPDRLRFWQQVLDGAAGDLVLDGREAEARAEISRLLAAGPAPAETAPIHLVEAGHGDPERLTLGAVRMIQRADLVVHTAAPTAAIRDLPRRDAETLVLGADPPPPPVLAALLAEAARRGRRVAWLTAGTAPAATLATLDAGGVTVIVLPALPTEVMAASAAPLL